MNAASEPLLPITDIAEKIGLGAGDLDLYGRYTAKISLDCLPPPDAAPKGKLILVTGITPTSAGEGKTVTTIGLAQALNKLGKHAVATLREPSLGPVFGIKGGATGGGKSQVLPAEKINLHFNGDKHAVAAAHNLLAAMLDAHIYHGNELKIDPGQIFWPRTVDMNDRALRNVQVARGGKINGTPRDTRFVITAASEIMAILALSTSQADCERRLGAITVAMNAQGEPVTAAQLQAQGAMMVLLQEALKPNLVQTTEHVPALVHAGPFANIAHGTSSIIAQRIALQRAEYVVNEAGFAADLGAEKYLDIVMPISGIKPSVAVLVATIRALQRHDPDSAKPSLGPGLANLAKHVENLRKYSLPVVVALNAFPDDSDDAVGQVRNFCAGLNVPCERSAVFTEGGAGAVKLAEMVAALADRSQLGSIAPLYADDLDLADKIHRVATDIYGARDIVIGDAAKAKLKLFTELGFGHLPVCIAKTQNSLSDDSKKLGAPKDWTFTASDAHLSSGAGFVVVIAGNMLLMPGLPKTPQAIKIHLTADGKIVGMN